MVLDLLTKNCVLPGHCSHGTFFNATFAPGKCELCQDACAQCSDGLSCDSCRSDFYFHLNQCFPHCPSLFYENSLNKSCDPCQPPCMDCAASAVCKSCIGTFYLEVHACHRCHETCENCASESFMKCQSCQSDRALEKSHSNSAYGSCRCASYTYQTPGNCICHDDTFSLVTEIFVKYSAAI